ncbi:ABC transporter permease [Acetobacter persici]|uniref:ABC transporter permease n=1 Tax=Acetobacter persici TaxID=1076596 RepID=UPI001BA7AEB5|nr:ABC transporter permease [Acetobacter persici]MBS1017278.1 ABC transporter permease [Acetobacter persici]
MIAYIFRRLSETVLLLVFVGNILFFGVRLLGDPSEILIDPGVSLAERAVIRHQYGFDQPILFQFWHFWKNTLCGDFGTSFVYHEPALALVGQRLVATVELACVAIMISLIFGIPLGLLAAVKQTSHLTRCVDLSLRLVSGLPSFWISLILIMVFSVELRWFPSSGRGQTALVFGLPLSIATRNGWRHIILPASELALFQTAMIFRLTRSGMQRVRGMDFVRFGRARGLTEHRLLFFHALPNVLAPLIPVMGLEFSAVIAMTVVTETIFNWPGVGHLLMTSIALLDRPVIIAYVLAVVSLLSLVSLLADLAHVLVDPRIARTGQSS